MNYEVLTALLSCVRFFVSFATFPYGVLDQVCYLIISIPDRCLRYVSLNFS